MLHWQVLKVSNLVSSEMNLVYKTNGFFVLEKSFVKESLWIEAFPSLLRKDIVEVGVLFM